MNNEQTRRGVLLTCLVLLLIGNFVLGLGIPSFQDDAGNNVSNLLLTSCLSLFFLFLAINERSAHISQTLPKWLGATLSALLLLGTASLLLASDKYAAIYQYLLWIVGFSLFVGSAILIHKNKNNMSLVAVALVTAGCILGALGIPHFLDPDFASRLRFTSLLYQHNAFGGFLLLPLSAGLALFVSTKGKKKLLSGLATAFLLALLILTFSRGSWASLIVAGFIIITVFHRSILRYRPARKVLLGIVLVIAGASAIAATLYGITTNIAQEKNKSVDIYSNEIAPRTSTIARLYYFKDAARIIAKQPLGVGLNNYELAAKINRSKVDYFSYDPHNAYLKMTAEIGIIGGMMFLVFVVGITITILKNLRHKDQTDAIGLFLTLGLVAAILHAAIDVDFSYPLNFFTFFIALGALFSYTGNKYRPAGNPAMMPLHSIVVFAVLTAVATAAVPLFIVENKYQDAKYFKNKGEYDRALVLIDDAARWMPTAAVLFQTKGDIYYNMALRTSIEQDKQYYLKRSLSELDTASRLNSKDSSIYDSRSKVYVQLADTAAAIQSLEQAITYDPVNNIDRHTRLASLYIENARYQDAVTLTDLIISLYPAELFNSYQWEDPNEDIWLMNIVQLLDLNATAHRKLGNSEKSQNALNKIGAYQASSSK